MTQPANKDLIPTIVSGPPYVKWMLDGISAIRLVLLQDEHQVRYPPGVDTCLTRGGVPRTRLITILGEAGSGMKAFVAWARSACTPVVVIECRWPYDGDRDFLVSGDGVGEATLAQLGRATPAELAALLGADGEWETGTTPPADTLVCLTRLERLLEPSGELRGEPLNGGIRGLLDHGRLAKWVGCLMLLGQDERSFSAGPSSQLTDFGPCYRLPQLRAAELAYGAPEGAQERTHVARTCLDWTGGQPLLSWLFFQRLEEVGIAHLDEVGPWLVDHEPPVVRLWQTQLRHFLTVEPRLRGIALDLAKGDRVGDDRLAPFTRNLFVGGWISRSRLRPGESPGQERWGMSRCHAAWAKVVLRGGGR